MRRDGAAEKHEVLLHTIDLSSNINTIAPLLSMPKPPPQTSISECRWMSSTLIHHFCTARQSAHAQYASARRAPNTCSNEFKLNMAEISTIHKTVQKPPNNERHPHVVHSLRTKLSHQRCAKIVAHTHKSRYLSLSKFEQHSQHTSVCPAHWPSSPPEGQNQA